jgi:uncharacterized membrane protein HdeD (DUF308 family)
VRKSADVIAKEDLLLVEGTDGKVYSGREQRLMFQPVGLIWGIVTLIFGILVMVYPNMLRYTVGIYLVIVGIWAVIAKLHLHF